MFCNWTAPPKGSAPDLSPDERPFFQKLSDYSIVHGDIYGITFAGRTAVVVSNLKMLKYLWQDLGDAVTGRINIAMLDFINPKQLGKYCVLFIQSMIGSINNFAEL